MIIKKIEILTSKLLADMHMFDIEYLNDFVPTKINNQQ